MATKEVKMVSLGDFLTEEQTRRCWGLYPNREQIRDKIVKPNLASINEKLGQENDADYLSYAIVHVIGQGRDQAKGEGATPGSRAGFRGERQVLDHGYIRLIESWGSDERIVETARTSTSKGFLGWSKDLPMKCSKCTKLDQDVLSPNYTGNPPCVDGTQNHEFIYQPGDEKLLAFLLEMHHDTPFEFGGLQLEIQAPIFVFREWHRHRTQSFSEASSRYEPLPDKNYVPTEDRLMMQVRSGDKKNRQATAVDGAVELTLHNALAFRNELSLEYQSDENFYQKYLKLGVPKELARVALPVGRYSKMRAQAVLRNWLAFLTLRKDMSAQYEIRVYADVLGEILQEVFPRTWDLFSLNHVGTWGQESLAYYDHQIKRLEARLEKMKAGRAKQFSAQVQEKATEGWDKQ